MEVKWIKLATNIFDDEKIQLIEQLPEADGVIVIWFKLLTLAGKQNNNGIFMLNDKIPYTLEMLSTIFRRKQPLVQLALETFKMFGMIEIIDNVYQISNWNKHQAIASRNDYMREYMAKKRAIEDVNVNKMLTVNNVSSDNKNKNKNKKENKKENENKENYYNDNFVEDNVMESDGNFNRLERLLVWSYLPKKGQPLTYLEGNLLIEWLQKYPPNYIEEKITQCALQPESKRSLAYLKGAIEKGWQGSNNALQGQKEPNIANGSETEVHFESVLEELRQLRANKGK